MAEPKSLSRVCIGGARRRALRRTNLKLFRTYGALTALIVATALPAIAGQGAKISWTPKEGTTSKYGMDVDAEGDFGQGPMKIHVSMKLQQTVKKVSDKEIVVEGKMTDMKISMDGNEFPAPTNEEVTTNTYAPNGELLSTKSSSGSGNRRMEQMQTFLYPDKTVNKGDTWSREIKGEKGGAVPATAKYTYVDNEKVAKWDCYKIDFTYTETKGDKPMSSKGSIWLDQATGETVKLTVTMKDVVFEESMPPMNATAKMMRE